MKGLLIGAAMVLSSWGATAADDPSVPAMCYRVLDAEITCNKAMIEFVGADSPVANHGRENIAADEKVRSQLPAMAKQYPDKIGEVCEGKFKTRILNGITQVVALLQKNGEQQALNKCTAAMNSIR